MNEPAILPMENHASDGFEAIHKAIVKLGEASERRGVKLRQTYVRVAQHAAIRVVGVDLCQENPYDGHTLAQAIATVEHTTGVRSRMRTSTRVIADTTTRAVRQSTSPAPVSAD